MLLLCRQVIALSLILSLAPVRLHPGRTDSKGGHWDNSTGEYHYHHGYAAHQHTDMNGDGILDCPYEFKDNTSHTSISASSGIMPLSILQNDPNRTSVTYPTSPPIASTTAPTTAPTVTVPPPASASETIMDSAFNSLFIAFSILVTFILSAFSAYLDFKLAHTEKELQNKESIISRITTDHTKSIESAVTAAVEKRESELKSFFAQKIDQLNSHHELELSQLEKKHTEKYAALDHHLKTELSEQDARHRKSIDTLREKYEHELSLQNDIWAEKYATMKAHYQSEFAAQQAEMDASNANHKKVINFLLYKSKVVYGPRYLLKLSDAPDGAIVDGNDLPHLITGPHRYDEYMLYVSPSHTFHTSKCQHRHTCQKISAIHISPDDFNIHRCKLCKPEYPDLTWYHRYLNLKKALGLK